MPANPDAQREAFAALERASKSLRRFPEGEVYGLVFYGTESLEAFGLVFATREGLAKRLRSKRKRPERALWPDVVDEIEAGSWNEGLGRNTLDCPRLNRLCERVRTNRLSKRSIELGLVNAILEAKRAKGPLTAPCFARRPFLGVHLPDSDMSVEVRVSKKVNDAAWHEKVLLRREHELTHAD